MDSNIRDSFFPYFIGLFAILLLIEGYLNWRDRRYHLHLKDSAVNVLTGLLHYGLGKLAFAFIFPVFFWMYEHAAFFQLGYSWWVVVLAIFAADHSLYWTHRFSHETRLGWATHIAHHSSQYYNLTVAVRQPWTQVIWFFFYLPPVLLGIPPELIILANAIDTIFQFFVHTERIQKLPRWVEFIFNTPSHHRVHHASNPRYLDKNYAGMFILYDRLFGSFKEEDEEKPVYGLTHNIYSYNPLYIQFHGWEDLIRKVRSADNFADAFNYIFRGPGWEPPKAPLWHRYRNEQLTQKLSWGEQLGDFLRTRPIRSALGRG